MCIFIIYILFINLFIFGGIITRRVLFFNYFYLFIYLFIIIIIIIIIIVVVVFLCIMRIELLMFMTGFHPDLPLHVFISKMFISKHLFAKLLAAFVIRINSFFLMFSFLL